MMSNAMRFARAINLRRRRNAPLHAGVTVTGLRASAAERRRG